MQSFRSAATLDRKEPQKDEPIEASVSENFVACMDVVGKIKSLSQLKAKLGNVPHTYSVTKADRWKRKEPTSDKKESSFVPNMTHPSRTEQSVEDLRRLAKDKEVTKRALYHLDDTRIEAELKKEKGFRMKSQTIVGTRLSKVGPHLERSSMVNVADPALLSLDKNVAMLRRPVAEKRLPPAMMETGSLREAVESLKNSLQQRLPAVHTLQPSSLLRGALTERAALSSHDGRGVMLTPADDQSAALDREMEQPKPKPLTRDAKTVRRSFLAKVEQANLIDKSSMAKPTAATKKEREEFKTGNLITETNIKRFEGFLHYFDRYSQMFQNFRVKGLQDYTAHPLEPYDTFLDPALDIEYFLQNNHEAQSRWVNPDGSYKWIKCRVVEYHKDTKAFDIVFDDGKKITKKTVTRMNLLFSGESEAELEERRVKANVVRCMQLLEQSFTHKLLSKDVLEKCKVFFSFQQFKAILEHSGLDVQMSNQSDFLSNYLLEIFDEYAISILRTYVLYKTSNSLQSFVHQSQ